MLYRKKIELPINAPKLSHPLIPRDVITDVYKANDLLSNANTQAEELLSRVREKCEALQKQTMLEFWERANALLIRWRRDHQEMCTSVEQHATLIVGRTIKHLLDETVEPQRLKSLLKQLLESQIPEINATLHYCPDEIDYIKHYFVNQRTPLWKLQPDDNIAPQTLVLKTDEGDFCISWDAMVENFLWHSKDC